MGDGFELKNGLKFYLAEAPGGLYNADQLKAIALLCDEDMALVKITEDQRLGLFIKDENTENVANSLADVGLGMRSYRSGVHQPTACIGELCPDHEQDALGAAMRISDLIASEGPSDHLLRIGVNGCAQCCVPCHTLDISIVGDENGFRLSLGGKNTQLPELAAFIAEGIPADELAPLISQVVSLHSAEANPGESLGDVMERIGVSPFASLLSPYSQDASMGIGEDEMMDDFSSVEPSEEPILEEHHEKDMNWQSEEEGEIEVEENEEVFTATDDSAEFTLDAEGEESAEEMASYGISPYYENEGGSGEGESLSPRDEKEAFSETLGHDINPSEFKNEYSDDLDAGIADLEALDSSTFAKEAAYQDSYVERNKVDDDDEVIEEIKDEEVDLNDFEIVGGDEPAHNDPSYEILEAEADLDEPILMDDETPPAQGTFADADMLEGDEEFTEVEISPDEFKYSSPSDATDGEDFLDDEEPAPMFSDESMLSPQHEAMHSFEDEAMLSDDEPAMRNVEMMKKTDRRSLRTQSKPWEIVSLDWGDALDLTFASGVKIRQPIHDISAEKVLTLGGVEIRIRPLSDGVEVDCQGASFYLPLKMAG